MSISGGTERAARPVSWSMHTRHPDQESGTKGTFACSLPIALKRSGATQPGGLSLKRANSRGRSGAEAATAATRRRRRGDGKAGKVKQEGKLALCLQSVIEICRDISNAMDIFRDDWDNDADVLSQMWNQ